MTIQMLPVERVIAALTHKPADHVPCEVRCTVDMEAEMVAYTGDKNYISKYIEQPVIRVDLEPAGEIIKPGFYKDVFGVIWNRTQDKNIGVPENAWITPENFKTYEFPEPLPNSFFPRARETFEKAKATGKYRLARLNLSLWERAWAMRGMENLMMDLAADPTFVTEYFGKICDYNCAVLKRAIQNLDFEAVHFGDDWGTQLGLMMSPQMWRTFIKPYIKKMYAIVRDAGKFVQIHSCGKVQELFEDIIEIGVQSFNPFQPEVIDVDWAIKTYKKRLCFWGGVSTQDALAFGTPEQVYLETKHLLELGKHGGVIVCPSHTIPPGSKPENIIAMLKSMQENS